MFINNLLKIDKLRFLPNWVILFIDVAVTFFATCLSFYLFLMVGIKIPITFASLVASIIYLVIITSSFYFFKTYSGIIRHSSFEDAVGLVKSLSTSFIIIFLINTFYNNVSEVIVFSNLLLFYSMMMAFVCLLLYRIVVKKIFEFYLESKNADEKVKVLIYGVNNESISTAQIINSNFYSKYKVVGFVAHNLPKNYSNSLLLKQKVLLVSKPMPVMLRYYKAEGVIIPQNATDKTTITKMVNDCLAYNYKVFSASTVKKWDTNKETTNINNFDIIDLLGRDSIKLDQTAIESNITNKVILITGAAGSIGSEIVRQVLKYKPKQLIMVDFSESALYNISMEVNALELQLDIKTIIADIRDGKEIENIFKTYKPNYVYHAAAYKHVPLMEENPAQAINTNVFGTINLANLSLKYQVEKFVMVSTDKAVRPSNVMGASKRIAEKYVQSISHQPNINTKFITTRFGNVLGSNGSVVPLFQKQIGQGGPITITHPDIIRYFMTISEACQLVLEAGAMGKGGEIFLFDMGEPVKIIDLANKMIRLAGYEPEKDIKIKIIGLRPGEKLYEELLTDSSKSIETYNEKITIAIDDVDNFEEIKLKISDLKHAVALDNKELMVTNMKNIVTDFKSLNSVYANLDH